MTTAPALEAHGLRALARLGSRMSLIYLTGTAMGAAAAGGAGAAPWWAGFPLAVQVLGLAMVISLGLGCSAGALGRHDRDESLPETWCERIAGRLRYRIPLIVIGPWCLPLLRAGVVAVGAALLAVMVSAGPLIGWPELHTLLGWVLPAVALGLALAAGPLWGLSAFAVLGAVLVVLVPGEGAAAVPTTLGGAAVSVVVAAVINVTARRGFATTEAAGRAAEAAAVARVRAERRLLASRRLDRVLHDTVLSTLTLLAHGGQGVAPEQVRAACRRDLAALRSDRWGLPGWGAVRSEAAAGPDAAGGAGDPGQDGPGDPVPAGVPVPRQAAPLAERLAAMRDLAARRGLDLRVHLQSPGTAASRPAGPEAPSPAAPDVLRLPVEPGVLDLTVLDAWSSALAECVVNITRHAGVAAADLVLGRTDDALVTLVVDEGAGFEASGIRPERLGLSGSVQDRLEDVGGRARVWSRPGEGTVVELVLPIPGSGPDPVPGQAVAAPGRRNGDRRRNGDGRRGGER